MKKPTRCIDPVIKYCQGCQYGLNFYPEDVERYEDIEYFDTKCMYDLEGTEPTEEELKEFDELVKKVYK